MNNRDDWMNHLSFLPDVARSDLEVLAAKESTYRGSWKMAGGRSAWFMFRRNMDRLINMMAPPPEPAEGAFSPMNMQEAVDYPNENGEVVLSADVARYMLQSWESEDIFRMIERDHTGSDGSVLACLRDLRRYAMLVESEMMAQGIVEAEAPGDDGTAAQALAGRDKGWKIVHTDYRDQEVRVVSEALDVPEDLAASNLASILRLLHPEWGAETIGRSVQHAISHNRGTDVYTQIAFLTGETREEVKVRAMAVIYGGTLFKPQDAALGERVNKAIRHAVNYHGLDARLNTIDHVIADLITPEVVRHLENRADVQLVEAGWRPGPDGEAIPPGTPEDGGHHARLDDGGNISIHCYGTSREQAQRIQQAAVRLGLREATRVLGDSGGRRWSLDFQRMRQEVIARIFDPVADKVCLTMRMHQSHEEITVRLFVRGGQLSFETVGSGIQASGEATEGVIGRLFEEWCVDDLPEPRELTTQLQGLDEIIDDTDKATAPAGDPPGLSDIDPMETNN